MQGRCVPNIAWVDRGDGSYWAHVTVGGLPSVVAMVEKDDGTLYATVIVELTTDRNFSSFSEGNASVAQWLELVA